MENIVDTTNNSANNKHTLGSEASVRFPAFNTAIRGKVDTGATTSSLHADRITMSNTQVSFVSPSLSSNTITLDVDSHQEVHSADGGGQQRPVVMLEVEIDGINVGPVEFNLNDRSGMTNELLIGQNILTAGNFVVDVQGGDASLTNDVDGGVEKKQKIKEAIQILRSANVTLDEMMVFIQTEAISKIQA